ncbi:non-hydrolyzing UDP-N-acetylglucosamine 2-epimerase [Pseudochelatococcus contaminans]|uniref:UDP-N-acetylglucosamine 2-epimerase (non-hydrolyzing) n=1 Tax=Pseudochelatococcus contaminans TaxID=1538103 RepID=A0A7W6EE57_9HYPH|nr:UDP-N-acetylglucosamine 2-epimerase (non-hydrolyzing) [Pseudochelatococcus contaminans]MBB3807980.1 UDP-N-acetylglucosamine 2-epimerase (non-hydrolyzing) [Pseudochelatococcus contaminans]
MRVLAVIGTRPEAIKIAPVIRELATRPGVEVVTCSTGQHRTMLDQVLSLFDIRPDHDLAIMAPNQTLNDITVRVISALKPVLAETKPDVVLVHGDTTTAMASALAAFHEGIRIGHVEAGLRTHDMKHPWPEEMNRRVIDVVADLLFAPTRRSRDMLLAEQLGGTIFVTGNTVIDALFAMTERIGSDDALRRQLDEQFSFIDPTRRLVLVTGHRRESFGDGFRNICDALARLAERPDIEIVYPVHLNPNVNVTVREALAGKPNIHLIAPLEYLPFVYLMGRAHIVLTDSGGVQEEAPSLGKPVLVMRDVTERPEAVAAGAVQLVGTHSERIVSAVARLLDDAQRHASFARCINPYGDGHAARRIADVLTGGAFSPFVASTPLKPEP